MLSVRKRIQFGSGRLRLRATARSFLVLSDLWLQGRGGTEARGGREVGGRQVAVVTRRVSAWLRGGPCAQVVHTERGGGEGLGSAAAGVSPHRKGPPKLALLGTQIARRSTASPPPTHHPVVLRIMRRCVRGGGECEDRGDCRLRSARKHLLARQADM